jgi:TatD DNase family protein
MSLFDSHCHLNDREAFPDPDQALREAREAGVGEIAVIGVDADSSAYALEIAERHEGVCAVVGWHPNHAGAYRAADAARIEELLRHPRAAAVGEAGLDYHWNYATAAEQERCLRDQLELARSMGKPIVFHCRAAYPALLELLEADPPGPCVFHCFSGDEEEARRAEALGAYFGVDGPITFPKSIALRRWVTGIDRSRLLIETDAPWMAPHPHRGKPNHPRFLTLVNEAVASCWQVTPEESAAITSSNARRFYGLD